MQADATHISHTLARYEAILKVLPDMVFEVDSNGQFLFFKAEPDQTFVELDRIIGNTIEDLLPQDVAEISMKAVATTLKTQAIHTISYTLPKPKGPKHFLAYLGPSSLSTVVAIVRDVTKELRPCQRKIECKARQIAEINKSMEQFVYVASHDLREPLTGLAGYATLLRKRYSDVLDERGNHFLNEIIEGTKRMEHKIDDLLAFSRAGKETPEGSFPLGAAIEEARRSLVGSINRTGAIINTNGYLPMVKGNRGMVAQIFQNLFSNSIKYRKKDTAPQIEIQAKPYKGGKWLISVKDNGIGFNQEHADRIFGVFQRLHTIEQYPGTGIGLAIAKKIVDRHGGKIWAESTPNKKTAFHFTLTNAESDQ
jgi:light-regulated signal transduction histidine kinase (bacteriophytochrome)